ncbi:hypothetical protein BKA70DRAFT_1566745 [Coprinopsis sp. MPI-PUGE-AT-0042]|nr:hypothetical protein BKA70DRAFT_1566745 [Coprinopsis sp. MPI-PUGE-AT-0042]
MNALEPRDASMASILASAFDTIHSTRPFGLPGPTNQGATRAFLPSCTEFCRQESGCRPQHHCATRHLASAPLARSNIADIEIVASSKAKVGSGRLDIGAEGGLYYPHTHSMGIKNRKKILASAPCPPS